MHFCEFSQAYQLDELPVRGRPKVLLAEIILVSVYLEINLEAVQLSFFREYVQYSNGNKINFPREVAN